MHFVVNVHLLLFRTKHTLQLDKVQQQNQVKKFTNDIKLILNLYLKNTNNAICNINSLQILHIHIYVYKDIIHTLYI